ncbi:TetR/AcrR family transcriptional regulator [Undibacterium sp. RuTC16W]|uniref:TetR/AcrR family transcriptional regulator n=1 Tax=Undibacterium sp. RuTC16W TaxID=3413048 RepID=UPI003BF07FCF
MSSLDDLSGRKRAILIAAEKCFAEQSYQGVSIRDIAHEAGVPVALVGYYFGAKNELYHAIYEHHSSYIAERLSELRRARLHTDPAIALNAIIAAFISPVLKLNEQDHGVNFSRIVMRGVVDRHEASDRITREFYDPMAREFIDALSGALPSAPKATVFWCYQFALGALLHHVVDTRMERLSEGLCPARNAEVATPHLLRFITAGILAAAQTGQTTQMVTLTDTPPVRTENTH